MWGWMLVLLEGLFIGGVLGQVAMARLAGLRVELISFGYGRPLLRRGRVQLALWPLGGFTRIAGLHPTEGPVDTSDPRAFFSRPLLLRLLVILGWPLGAQLFVICFTTATLLLVGRPSPSLTPVVESVVTGSSAEEAGLRVDDEVLSVDGKRVAVSELALRLNETEGRPFVLELRRGGEPLSLTMKARPTPDGGWRMGVRIKLSEGVERPALGEALVLGVLTPFATQRTILLALGGILSGSVQAEVVGPVGMVRVVDAMLSDAKRFQTVAMFGAFGVLWSVMPLPPLPGAQLLLVLFGWRSRPRRSATPARDLGEVPTPPRTFPPALLAAIVPLVAIVALSAPPAFERPERAVTAVVWGVLAVALALRLPRAWSWGVYLPLLNIMSVASQLEAESWMILTSCAVLLVVPATLLLPPVLRAFARSCPACGKLAAAPVRSSPRSSCLACGSSWRFTG